MVGLRLIGRRTASDARDFLERAAHWLAQRGDDPVPSVSVEDGVLIAELHPAAEPVVIEASPSGATLSASTLTAGPGYHRHVAAIALELGAALGVEWAPEGDSTGWLAHRDDARLERAFLEALADVAHRILALAEQGKRGFSLFMPADHAYEHGGFVATPLGPRDEAWVRAVADDPRRGEDAFAWWGAEKDGRYYLGLALVCLWLEVRWRPPIDEGERALLERVATWIERAHALDPSLAIPWDEQAEILSLLGEESLRATRAQIKASARPPAIEPIGYRRRPVRVTLSGGWSMRIPGELAERWEERGTWVAWDARRSVWFTSMTVRTEDGAPSPSTEATLAALPPLTGDDLLELERGDLRGLARFVEDVHEGERVLRLEAHAARGDAAAIGTIVFVDESEREEALAIWGSLRHQA